MRKCTLSSDRNIILVSLIFVLSSFTGRTVSNKQVDVVVVGGGTGAIAAAIQSARSGAETVLVNPFPWLGGMLTSAGVSATDGNHNLPAGLWEEYRSLLRRHYGGKDSLFTGWVSNTMFEPRVGADYWSVLADREERLVVHSESTWKLLGQGQPWRVVVKLKGGGRQIYESNILVDGTDLGDLAAAAGAGYDVGMDSRKDSGESIAPEQANAIVQDITYVAILKDYGKDRDMTIPKPDGYTPGEFACTCRHEGCTLDDVLDCSRMMTYGKLPGRKYMINWPRKGNDFGVNLVEMDERERRIAEQEAKAKTLRYVYFLQHELGFRHLGLADDEFPTSDLLPFYPYHREGRRVKGIVRMNLNHITDPFHDGLFRTGIAVGDYPIDHHHGEVPEAPDLDFPPVPSYSVPMGCLIPAGVEGLLIADKAISVSNIVNGTTRLQPVVIQIGQAAGLMAALAVEEGMHPRDLDPRMIQESILDNGGYIMPYFDVPHDDHHFGSIQKIGATGMLRGTGFPFQWANRTYFYPDSNVITREFLEHVRKVVDGIEFHSTNPLLSVDEGLDLLFALIQHLDMDQWPGTKRAFREHIARQWTKEFQLRDFGADRPIKRREMAVLLDRVSDLFQFKKVDFHGNWK